MAYLDLAKRAVSQLLPYEKNEINEVIAPEQSEALSSIEEIELAGTAIEAALIHAGLIMWQAVDTLAPNTLALVQEFRDCSREFRHWHVAAHRQGYGALAREVNADLKGRLLAQRDACMQRERVGR